MVAGLTLWPGDEQELTTGPGEVTTTSPANFADASAQVRFDARSPGEVFALTANGDPDLVNELAAAQSPSEVFALTEQAAAGIDAGLASSIEEPLTLPATTRAAAPDGRGGVVYLADDQIWWVSEPTAGPVALTDQSWPVLDLVGLRQVGGEPMVLVLIGGKLLGYDRGESELVTGFDALPGTVLDLAVDGSTAVAVVDTADGTAVIAVTMSTGDQVEIMAPVDPSAAEAEPPVAVAVSGDRIVVLQQSETTTALVFGTDGTKIGSVELGVPSSTVLAVDLAGDQLLTAFGEAATVTDIVTGNREVVDGVEGWVLAAAWADPPTEPTSPPDNAIRRFRVDAELVESDINDPFLNIRQGPGTENDLLAKLPPQLHRHPVDRRGADHR